MSKVTEKKASRFIHFYWFSVIYNGMALSISAGGGQCIKLAGWVWFGWGGVGLGGEGADGKMDGKEGRGE